MESQNHRCVYGAKWCCTLITNTMGYSLGWKRISSKLSRATCITAKALHGPITLLSNFNENFIQQWYRFLLSQNTSLWHCRMMLRVSGGLYFGNCNTIHSTIQREGGGLLCGMYRHWRVINTRFNEIHILWRVIHIFVKAVSHWPPRKGGRHHCISKQCSLDDFFYKTPSVKASKTNMYCLSRDIP